MDNELFSGLPLLSRMFSDQQSARPELACCLVDQGGASPVLGGGREVENRQTSILQRHKEECRINAPVNPERMSES